MQFFNSKTGNVEPFIPINAKNVSMYVCGPTVYAAPHIGNARPAVVFDVLFRILRQTFGVESVSYVSNFTDIDDKIIKAANEKNRPIDQITKEAIDNYNLDIQALNVLPVTKRTFATDYVNQMIDMIQKLINSGHAYVTKLGDVAFSVPSNPYKGLESDRNDYREDEERNNSSDKKDPRDFILWKLKKDGEPFWSSPWGDGRPGWHIECSTMIAGTLGETIDIHGGGIDLKFPHHEAELAQNQCAHNGTPLATFWMHNGLISYGSQKMGKRHGNITLVRDLLVEYPAEAVRLSMLLTHYRQTLDFVGNEPVARAKDILDSLYKSYYDFVETYNVSYDTSTKVEINSEFMSALENDMNTPLAISILHKLAKELKTSDVDKFHSFVKSARLLGILELTPDVWFHSNEFKLKIESLIQERQVARENKDWSKSDEIREVLSNQFGVIIEDSNKRMFWKTKTGPLMVY
jgi:cysteinyl-tRNA synthetase